MTRNVKASGALIWGVIIGLGIHSLNITPAVATCENWQRIEHGQGDEGPDSLSDATANCDTDADCVATCNDWLNGETK